MTGDGGIGRLAGSAPPLELSAELGGLFRRVIVADLPLRHHQVTNLVDGGEDLPERPVPLGAVGKAAGRRGGRRRGAFSVPVGLTHRFDQERGRGCRRRVLEAIFESATQSVAESGFVTHAMGPN